MYESVGQKTGERDLIEVIPCYNKEKRQCCRGKWRRCSHLHIKAKVLLLFKEEIEHKLPHKVGVQRVIDYFCPTKLEKRVRRERERERKRKSTPCRSICAIGERKNNKNNEGYNLMLFCFFCGFRRSQPGNIY